MQRTRFHLMAVTSTMLIAASIQPATAEQPEPQLRYFAVLLPYGETLPPELLAPESHLMIVHDNDVTPNPAIQFCDESPILGGTEWYRADTTHVTKGGAETLVTFWLDEQPPNGAVAWTGPDGDVESVNGPHYWRPSSGAGGECGPTLWWVDDEPVGSFVTVYLGIGLFSK